MAEPNAHTEDHEMSIDEIVAVLTMFRGFVTSGQHVHPTVYMQQLNKFEGAIAALKKKSDWKSRALYEQDEKLAMEQRLADALQGTGRWPTRWRRSPPSFWR